VSRKLSYESPCAQCVTVWMSLVLLPKVGTYFFTWTPAASVFPRTSFLLRNKMICTLESSLLLQTSRHRLKLSSWNDTWSESYVWWMYGHVRVDLLSGLLQAFHWRREELGTGYIALRNVWTVSTSKICRWNSPSSKNGTHIARWNNEPIASKDEQAKQILKSYLAPWASHIRDKELTDGAFHA
jgi:hypothetical protein